MVLKKCILMLESGKVFNGFSCGADVEARGEVVFNTGVFGYQEIVTDCASWGQLICFAHPHVGDCGFNDEDFQSSGIKAAGLFFKEYSIRYSNWRAEFSMQDQMIKDNVPAMEGFDTRALVKYIRENGTMNGVISTKDFSLESLVKKVKQLQPNDKTDLVSQVTCKKQYVINGDAKSKTIAVIDYGCLTSFISTFKSQGYKIIVFPANVTAKEILLAKVDGIFLSSGPGTATNSMYTVDMVKEIIKTSPKISIFAVGFGLQVLALTYGAKVVKHKIGHRGANYPVRNLQSKRIEITLQNNGFYTDEESIKQNSSLNITHVNLYDNTIAGFENKQGNVFGVEYYPALDSDETGYLLKKFFNMVEKHA